MKKYNFNAGPSMLPREVIEATAQQCLDFNGSKQPQNSVLISMAQVSL